MVRMVGIEPTTSVLSGLRSNLLSHIRIWGDRWDLNPRDSEPQSDALGQLGDGHMERITGLEPATFALARRRSTK